jgi:lysophospholipase L1-like esterase
MRLLVAPFVGGLIACGPGDASTFVVVKDGGSGAAADGGGAAAEMDGAAPVTDAGPGGADSGGDAEGGTPGVDSGGADAGADPPAVRFVGRRDEANPLQPRFGWPGGRMVARFSGTGASVSLNHADGVNGGTTWFDVLVDGVVVKKISTTTGTSTYALAAGLPSAVHTVELVKRTEASLGDDQFVGFTFTGGALLAPPPAKTRRVEFVGDSMIQGFGVEGVDPCPGGATADTHNARLAMPSLVAKDLDAEDMSTTYSGKGIGRNEDVTDPLRFGALYPRALPDVASSMWSFASSPADVIVIVLGGTDFEASPAPTAAAYTTTLGTFFDIVRGKNPASHVILAVGGQISNNYPVGAQARTRITQATNNVVAARNGAGDARVYPFVFTESDGTNTTGCYEHANATLHRQWADMIIPFIKSKTGW